MTSFLVKFWEKKNKAIFMQMRWRVPPWQTDSVKKILTPSPREYKFHIFQSPFLLVTLKTCASPWSTVESPRAQNIGNNKIFVLLLNFWAVRRDHALTSTPVYSLCFHKIRFSDKSDYISKTSLPLFSALSKYIQIYRTIRNKYVEGTTKYNIWYV